MRLSLSIGLIFFVLQSLQGQDASNKRCKSIDRFDQAVSLDSLSIDPATIVLSQEMEYVYNLDEGTISIQKDEGINSVEICYRVFPFALNETHATHSLDEYDSTIASKPIIIASDFIVPQREEIFSVSGIQKTGSISRGVSFGSNQDVFVNSALNLQMEGELSDNLNIRAVITDQNIPFQPEGNTQQIQDFDNVYIQLFNDDFEVTAGDVVLRNKPSEFLRYYKNVQGGQAIVRYDVGNELKGESSAAFSVAKGRFASTQVDPFEGVTGPYKLRGPNNERFIIVLANSEKVYLDGKLLSRGFNNDYVIDYNLAEITFNNHIVITKFSRIRVDFEFSDQNYSRSIIETSHYFESEKSDFQFNFYREKDNRNQPLSLDLTNTDRQQLSQVGDDIDQAIVSGVDSVGFNENLILYKQMDTLLVSGEIESILKFSTNPDSAKFLVRFSDVGFGNGDYVLLNSTANGRIYEWVSPQNGQSQGNYAPVTQVTTPSMKQMMTLGGGVKLSATDRIFTELALSNQDVNLFSALGNNDNQGYAMKIGYQKEAIDVGFLPGYKLSGSVDYEYDQKDFRGIDRFRYIEFDRDWGIRNLQASSLADNIVNATTSIKQDENNLVNYHLVGRKRGDEVNGLQHHWNVAKSLGRMQVNSKLFFMNNDQDIQQTEWRRWVGETFYRSKYFQPGYQYTTDRNKAFFSANDSITTTAMNYDEHLVFLRNSDTLKTRFNINYALREDRLPFNGELVDNNRSKTASMVVGSTIKDNHNLNVTFTYRNLENLRAVQGDQKNEETIMGRLDWSGSFFKDHIRSELTYTTNNSRELKREFVFLEVNTGLGTHTWRDQNEDGVQDLSEFFEAINPDERNYVKIFVPTDEFIDAFSNLFNYRITANMPRKWQKEGGVKSLLGRLSNVTAINLDKKITDDDVAARFLPFSNDVNDEDLIAIRQRIRSTFFFNRANPGYAMDLGLNFTDGKQLLTSGIESRNNDEYSLNLRYNLDRNYNFTVKMLSGQKGTFSDFLEGRNYIINTKRIGPEFAWQPSNRFRLSTGYSYTNKQNIYTENQGEEVISNEFKVEIRVTRASSSSINSTFRFINNDFEGDENTALGYELLDALRPGKNATWNFNLQRKLANGLRITVNYEGRKSPAQKVIHIGRMQVTALF